MTAGGVITTPRRGSRTAVHTVGCLALGGLLALASVVGAIVFGARHVTQVSTGRTFGVDDVPERAVAMVLGAKADGRQPSAFLAARLDLAVELYEKGTIKAVLVSGDNTALSHYETTVMRDYLVTNGVPTEQVVEDPAGYDTYES